MVLYPTEQWLTEYKRQMNASEQLDAAGAGWGVDFDGSFLFEITDVPIEQQSLGDLPNAALEGLPDHLRAQLSDIPLSEAPSLIDESIREHLPDRSRDLLEQLDEHIVDGNVYALVGLYDGGCEEVDILSGPDERDVGFVLRGTYPTWQRIIDGQIDPIPAVMSGDLEIDGDMQQVLKYSDATQLLGEIASDIDTIHMF